MEEIIRLAGWFPACSQNHTSRKDTTTSPTFRNKHAIWIFRRWRKRLIYLVIEFLPSYPPLLIFFDCLKLWNLTFPYTIVSPLVLFHGTALRFKNGTYLTNEDIFTATGINAISTTYAAGTLFTYYRRNKGGDFLFAPGPTSQPLELYVSISRFWSTVPFVTR